MPAAPFRYTSPDEDSARWTGFPFRSGDIVISTRSKSGTTWMQMICALLVFQNANLPAPLAEVSPWLDWLVEPRETVIGRLQAQDHRRFIKSHTPLDGLPLDPRASYVVVARHPLDMAVSLYHQGANLNRHRIRELTGQPAPVGTPPPRLPLREWLLEWVDDDPDPRLKLDSLPGVMWHLTQAWVRRDWANVMLIHYDDLLLDLEGEMRRLADRLGITLSSDRMPALVAAATFASMRGLPRRLVPDPAGVLRDPSAFFRSGRSGDGRQVLSASEYTHYQDRVATLAEPDVVRWLHREDAG